MSSKVESEERRCSVVLEAVVPGPMETLIHFLKF